MELAMKFVRDVIWVDLRVDCLVDEMAMQKVNLLAGVWATRKVLLKAGNWGERLVGKKGDWMADWRGFPEVDELEWKRE